MKPLQRILLAFILTLVSAITTTAVASSATKQVSFNQAGFDKYKKVLYRVSQETGESATTLAAYSSIETNMRANVCNRSGSGACGLTQFLPGTWNAMVKQHHRKYGLSKNVSRSNAYANLAMTAEYIKSNRALLEKALKRDVSPSEVYLAHALGPGNALKVLRANPNKKITAVLHIHRGNNSLLYSKGKALTVAQFKANMQRKFSVHSSTYRPAVNQYALNRMMDDPQRGLDHLIAQVSTIPGVPSL